MKSRSSDLGLILWVTNVLFTSLYLCLCCGRLPTFTFSSAEFQVLCWDFWFIWNWVLYRVRDKSLVSSACPKNKHLSSRDLQEAKNISTFMTEIYFSFLFFSTLDLTFVYCFLIHALSDFNSLSWRVNLHLILVLEKCTRCRDTTTIWSYSFISSSQLRTFHRASQKPVPQPHGGSMVWDL